MTQTLIDLLRDAAPGLRVTAGTDPWHGDHARADLPAEAVRFAYLFARDREARLALYPADTLVQARAFYKDDARVRNTLALDSGGDWSLRPNFHFGYREKGLVWSESQLGLLDYTDYWRARIHTLANFPRARWERELQRLVDDRVFDPARREQFDVDFTKTKRAEASPRPGLRLSRGWPLSATREPDFVGTLGGALRTALAALGEHRTLQALESEA